MKAVDHPTADVLPNSQNARNLMRAPSGQGRGETKVELPMLLLSPPCALSANPMMYYWMHQRSRLDLTGLGTSRQLLGAQLMARNEWLRQEREQSCFAVKMQRLAALVFLAAPAFAQYAGPQLLSRRRRPRGHDCAPDRFYSLPVGGCVYDTGLAGVSLEFAGRTGECKAPKGWSWTLASAAFTVGSAPRFP